MYSVVCAVHQKKREREREQEKEREPQGDAVLFCFFPSRKHLQFFCRDARMQEAVISNFWNKRRLQMNETVVRFNLVNT